MRKHLTPIQAVYPVPKDFVILAKRWHPDAIDILLGYIWQGFDKLADEEFDANKADENLEDDITYAAYCRINDTISPFSPCQVIHQPLELEHRKSGGQAPHSDLGFRLRASNVRSHFTTEAKVIRTEGGISKYVSEITDNLLTGRYSAFSSVAAMLGYLFSGRPDATFKAICNSLNSPLHPYPPFIDRNHRYSYHDRKTNNNRISSVFLCHHLLILFDKANRIAQKCKKTQKSISAQKEQKSTRVEST